MLQPETRIDTAGFQRLKLNDDKLLSCFAFKSSLCPCDMAMEAAGPAPPEIVEEVELTGRGLHSSTSQLNLRGFGSLNL